jgi:hypothetical protein
VEVGCGLKGRQFTDGEFSQQVRDWLQALGVDVDSWYVDSTATSFITQLSRDQVRGVWQPDIDVDDGLRLVARSLTNGRLKVHESCTGLIEEFPSYVWDDKTQLRGERDRPIKVADHSLDAYRSGVFSTSFMWEMLPVLEEVTAGR